MQHKEKHGWNNTSARQTSIAILTVRRHVVCELTFVSGLDHCCVLVVQRGITTSIKHVLPARLLETSTSVTSRRRDCLSSFFVASSTQVVFTCLVDSSVSRPHHCLPQRLSTVFPPSSLLLKTSLTLPHHSSALPRGSRRLLSRSSPGAVCTGLA